MSRTGGVECRLVSSQARRRRLNEPERILASAALHVQNVAADEAAAGYGHILPVELITDENGIGYTDARLPLRLQTSLGNRIRLWNLDGFGPEIDGLAGAGTGDAARRS